MALIFQVQSTGILIVEFQPFDQQGAAHRNINAKEWISTSRKPTI